MRVLLIPADRGACGRYRMLYPADAVVAAGHDVIIRDDGDRVVDNALVWREEGKPDEIHAADIPECDVAVFQRPASSKAVPIMRFYKRQGVRVVIELDDNIHAIPPTNQSWWAYRHPESNTRNMTECLKLADRIVVSTPDLARAYGTDVIVENCIPDWYAGIKTGAAERTLGWGGSLAVHRHDLRVVGGGLVEAMRAEPGWTFTVIGESKGVGRELGFESDPPETGWIPINEYLEAMSRLTIGIAPLADNVFNRGKSWLKALEYAALGVPCIVSDLPEYRRLGVGEAVSKPKHWKAALRKLMGDPEARADQVAHNIEVARRWTYEANAERWWEAWTGN